MIKLSGSSADSQVAIVIELNEVEENVEKMSLDALEDHDHVAKARKEVIDQDRNPEEDQETTRVTEDNQQLRDQDQGLEVDRSRVEGIEF